MQKLVNAIRSLATEHTYKKGSILVYQGETPRAAHIVLNGFVKVYSINDNGEEKIINFHGSHDMWPTLWIFKRAERSLYFYETYTPSKILTLDRDVLYEYINKPAFRTSAFDFFISNYTGLLIRVRALQQSKAREKILLTFYFLIFRYGEAAGADKMRLTIPLTHSALAGLTGLSRETTTIELIELKKRRILDYSRHKYIINRARLEETLDEDSFKEFMN